MILPEETIDHVMVALRKLNMVKNNTCLSLWVWRYGSSCSLKNQSWGYSDVYLHKIPTVKFLFPLPELWGD